MCTNNSVFTLLLAVRRVIVVVTKGEFLQLPHVNLFGLPHEGKFFKSKAWSPVRGRRFESKMNTIFLAPLWYWHWKYKVNVLKGSGVRIGSNLKVTTAARVSFWPMMSAGVSGWSHFPAACSSARSGAQERRPSPKLPGAALRIWSESAGHLSKRISASEGICSPLICLVPYLQFASQSDQMRKWKRQRRQFAAQDPNDQHAYECRSCTMICIQDAGLAVTYAWYLPVELCVFCL